MFIVAHDSRETVSFNAKSQSQLHDALNSLTSICVDDDVNLIGNLIVFTDQFYILLVIIRLASSRNIVSQLSAR